MRSCRIYPNTHRQTMKPGRNGLTICPMSPTSLGMNSRVSTPTGWLILAAFALSMRKIARWLVAAPTNTQE